MLIKIDLLSVECLDKIHNCIDLICDHGYAERKKTLKETYESIIGVYNLERKSQKMWKMIWDHKIYSLFQMEKQSGTQGIALIKPKDLNDLTVLNSVIRLMASEKGGEQPLNMWARYRKDINLWIEEMRRYGLNEEEISWLSKHEAITNGICESQEGLMSLVQEQRLGGNNLTFADKCRKGIAKKQGKLFEECEEIYYKNIKEKNCSEILAHYVWDVLLKVQRGYSFNRSHCLAYSIVALQEMNLCLRYPIIFWNCACLITDSGNEGSGTDYTKIAKAIGAMRSSGIDIGLPDINKASFGFEPDVDKNQIIFGLKGLSNVGDDVVKNIIDNRPYSSLNDFIEKVNPNKQAMISLIKCGSFDELMDRKKAMESYLWLTCDKKKNLTLANMGALIKYNLLPDTDESQKNYKIYEFNRYLKAQCKYNSEYYKLDCRAINFLETIDCESLIETNELSEFLLKIKSWDKTYKNFMDYFKLWINKDKENILITLNNLIFKEEWDKYAYGNISSWEMDSMCFYYHNHELIDINKSKYGFRDFNDIPEEPQVESTWEKGGHKGNKFKIFKLCGTCIAKDKNKAIVSLLTTNGVVDLRIKKEVFSLYDKRISTKLPDGSKKFLENSWFDRGSMIAV